MCEMDNYMTLGLEDLQEEYTAMAERYKQQIHELKRNLNTAKATQAYLSAELDLLGAQTPPRKNTDRIESELENVRRTNEELRIEQTVLQQEHEAVCAERDKLHKRLQEANSKLAAQMQQSDALSTNNERVESLEQENLELVEKLDQLREKDVHNSCTQLNLQKSVERLEEQVHCLEQNLQSKREALDEKTLLLESAQEQLAEVNAQLAALKTAPDDAERKGNSLFAEVDDQRQVMKQLLTYQKKSYSEMKTKFDASEHEIRSLKRENAAMHTELQTCLSIFCNADKKYQEKLKDRIRTLTNQNECLEKKLKWTQERLREMADTKGVLWLDSMFNFCKQETEDLKQQIQSSCIQKASLEEHLRNVEQEMARWRFEALKLRCITLNRENLLNEHKIEFQPRHTFEIRITDYELSTAEPNIGNVDTNVESKNAPQTSNSVDEHKSPELEKELNAPCAKHSPTNIKVEPEENKENISNEMCEETSQHSLQCTQELDTIDLPGPSKLCKPRDILPVEPCARNVRFSEKNICISPPPATDCTSPTPPKNVITVKNQITKSNVVVRRIKLGSKP